MRETAGDCWDTQPLVWLSTAMGPLFTFALMWMGLFLLKTLSTRKKMLGFVLVSGNLPLARILTVALGGGGELVVYRILFPALDFDELRLLGVTVDLFFIIPNGSCHALYAREAVAKAAANNTTYDGPLIVIHFYTLGFLNSLLKQGIMAEQLFLGTPTFILLHTLLIISIMSYGWRSFFAKPKIIKLPQTQAVQSGI